LFYCSSMKKGEGETIKKLKLEDYEIGRVLGKGKNETIKVDLARLRSPRTKKQESMLP
jgi:hypothetical protein